MSQEEKKNQALEEKSQEAEQPEADESEVEQEPTLEELQEKIEALQAEREDFYNKYLASEADAQNIRRRAEIDVANAHKFALEKFVKALLPILDAIELEQKAIAESEIEGIEQFQEGSQLTYRMLIDACARFGVKQINPEGEKLNPELHQAITMVPHHEAESNTIIQVIQNGYLLNDRLIRAAQVVVAQ